MLERDFHLERLAGEEFLPMVQFPLVTRRPALFQAPAQLLLAAKAADHHQPGSTARQQVFQKILPFPVLNLGNMRHIQQYRITELEILLGDAVECIIQVPTYFQIFCIAAGVRKERIRYKVVIQVDRIHPLKYAARHIGLPAAGHAHNQDQGGAG